MKFLIVLVAAVALTSAASVLDPKYASFRGREENGRVVGGQDIYDHIPFIVSLRVPSSHSCGGAIISEDWVITAAHCLTSSVSSYNIYYGNNTRSYQTDSVKAAKIFRHEQYNSPRFWNDIGLIQLAQKIPIVPGFTAIIPLETEELLDGALPIVLYGWGRTSTNGAIPNQLQVIDLEYMNYERCYAAHTAQNRDSVSPDHFCTFTKFGQGACNGDSGGPLVYNNKLVALVNWGIACAQGYPDVHCKISAYIDWIQKIIADNS